MTFGTGEMQYFHEASNEAPGSTQMVHTIVNGVTEWHTSLQNRMLPETKCSE